MISWCLWLLFFKPQVIFTEPYKMVMMQMRRTNSSLTISKEMCLIAFESPIPSHTSTVPAIPYHSDIKLFALLHIAINSMTYIVPYYLSLSTNYSRGIQICQRYFPSVSNSDSTYNIKSRNYDLYSFGAKGVSLYTYAFKERLTWFHQ